MKHHAKRLAPLSLLVLLSGCALDTLWLDEAQKQCDQAARTGSDRMDCYERAQTQSRENNGR